MNKLKELMKNHVDAAKGESEDESKDILHIGVVLDASGSMGGSLEIETVTGFNGYVNKLREDITDKNIYLTLLSFNTLDLKYIYNNIPLEEVEPLGSEYVCEGGTPLLDAVMRMVTVMEEHAKEEDGVAIVIITDGYENSSQKTNQTQLRNKVVDLEKKGWSFTYMGANIDAFAASELIGINRGSTLNYDQRFQGNALWAATAQSNVRYSNSKSIGGSYIPCASSFTADERVATGDVVDPESKTSGDTD